MELIPYIGPILGALPPVLVALFTDPITRAVGGAAVRRPAAARGPRGRAADVRPHAAHQPAAGDLRAAARRCSCTASSARWWRCRSWRCCARRPSTAAATSTLEPWERSPRAAAVSAGAPRRSIGAAGLAQALRRAGGAARASASRSRGGELVAVIGPNGAGKTTLLSIVAGVQRPASAGERRRGRPRAVGWVPQQPALYSKLSVAENLRLFARLEGSPSRQAAVARMLEQTGLRRARRRAGRSALGRQPPARERRARAARRPAGARAGRAVRVARPRASASGCGSSSGARAARARRCVFSTHNVGEARAPRRPRARARRRASCCSTARRERLLARAGGERDAATSSGRSCAFLRERGATGGGDRLPMRWLLRKDLRDPAPLAAAGGGARALPGRDRAADRPRDLARPGQAAVAIVDETPPGETIDGRRPAASKSSRVRRPAVQTRCSRCGCHARAGACEDVEAGKALAAVVIPRGHRGAGLLGRRAGAAWKCSTTATRSSSRSCGRQLNSALAQANVGLLATDPAGGGGGDRRAAAGRQRSACSARRRTWSASADPRATLKAIVAAPAAAAPSARSSNGSTAFATFAVGEPRRSQATCSRRSASRSRSRACRSQGRRTPLNTFAVVVAVSVSLMFVCVLLARRRIGARARGARARAPGQRYAGVGLARGAARREGAAGRRLRVRARARDARGGRRVRDASTGSRVGSGSLALAFGALAFAALGVAIGALAREVRAASLLAFLLALPLAFLALVPAGAVSHGIYNVVAAISFVFPFKACAAGARRSRQRRLARARRVGRAPARAERSLFAALARVGLRRAGVTSGGDGLSRRRVCAGCARARGCAGSCARRSCARAARAAAVRGRGCPRRRVVRVGAGRRRSPVGWRCRRSIASRSRRSWSGRSEAHELGVGRRDACSACPPTRTRRARARGTRRASCSWRCGAIKQALPELLGDDRRVPVRVHRPRTLRGGAGDDRRAAWTTTPRSSCSRAPPSATRAPAPTWWRRRT